MGRPRRKLFREVASEIHTGVPRSPCLRTGYTQQDHRHLTEHSCGRDENGTEIPRPNSAEGRWVSGPPKEELSLRAAYPAKMLERLRFRSVKTRPGVSPTVARACSDTTAGESQCGDLSPAKLELMKRLAFHRSELMKHKAKPTLA